jgi:cytochrome P450
LCATEIAKRRAAPGPDLLTQLITAHEAQDRLTEDEIVSTTILLLLNAGHEATVHAMGNGLRTLFLASNEDRTGWLADPDAMTEEILRHTPPLHMFTRYVLEDCELFGMYPSNKATLSACILGLPTMIHAPCLSRSALIPRVNRSNRWHLALESISASATR